MGKKITTGIILFLLFCISGCSGSYTGGSSSSLVSTPAQSEIPTDTEIIEEMKTGKTPAGKVVGQQDEDLLELKHWKYASKRAEPSVLQSPGQPVSPQLPQQPQLPVVDELGSDTWETVSIPILSQEEIEQIIKKLIDSGYIKEPVSSKLEFQTAVRHFQRDNSLPGTGVLDGPTRELLRGK